MCDTCFFWQILTVSLTRNSTKHSFICIEVLPLRTRIHWIVFYPISILLIFVKITYIHTYYDMLFIPFYLRDIWRFFILYKFTSSSTKIIIELQLFRILNQHWSNFLIANIEVPSIQFAEVNILSKSLRFRWQNKLFGQQFFLWLLLLASITSLIFFSVQFQRS